MNDKIQNQSSLEQFIHLASQDPQLQQKLKAATEGATTDLEAALRSLVELGKEFGYHFTSSEVAERLNLIIATPEDPLSELSDVELEAVAGGGPGESAGIVSILNCCSGRDCNPHAGHTGYCNFG